MGYEELFGRDLITTQDWSREELDIVLNLGKEFKQRYYTRSVPESLKNKTFSMLFYNTSTRTRSSFEAAMTALGGHAQFIDARTTRAGEGEAPKDMAKMYERYGHGLGIRILESAVNYEYGRGTEIIRECAKHAKVPVISMADDKDHPTQALTDMMTIQEKFPKYEGKKYVIMWGYSKKIRSWAGVQCDMLIASRYGVDITLAYPDGFNLDSDIVEQSKKNAGDSGAKFEISHDYKEALDGADLVFPRNWASHQCYSAGINNFGRENEIALHNKFKDWKLTQDLVDLMDKNSKIMHVLPVFRGEEATDEVMDGPHSAVYDQAENNLYTRMAVLALTMGGK